jgi:hypothetical protein
VPPGGHSSQPDGVHRGRPARFLAGAPSTPLHCCPPGPHAIAEPIACIKARGNELAADGSNHERDVMLSPRAVRESATAQWNRARRKRLRTKCHAIAARCHGIGAPQHGNARHIAPITGNERRLQWHLAAPKCEEVARGRPLTANSDGWGAAASATSLPSATTPTTSHSSESTRSSAFTMPS